MRNPFQIYRGVYTPAQRKQNRKNLLLGMFSGILLGFSFPPFHFPFLIFVGLIPYFIVLQKKEGLAEINRFTYFTFFIFNIITIYWVGSWTHNADPFLEIAGSVLMFFNPLLFLIPSTLYYFTKKILKRNIALFLFPLFWVTYEYAYSITDFRFPWLTLGNSLPYFKQFIQIADIVGVYGLTLFIIYINIFFYKGLKNIFTNKSKSVVYFVVGIVLFLIPLVYGIVKINTFEISNTNIKIGLVQPNFDPTNKWDGGSLDKQLETYLSLSRKAIKQGAEIIAWPETALPVYLLDGNYYSQVQKIYNFCDSNNVALISGMPDANFYFHKENAPQDAKPVGDGKTLYTSYNSILMFSPHSYKIQKYQKMKLVPFGEKVPLVESFPWLADIIKWNVGIGGWNTGKDTVVFNLNSSFIKDTAKTLPHNINIAGIVCIESIFPDFVAAFVNKGANIIVVVTNDSWYGDSSGPYQHKEISVLRAVENRRSVVRAANGGISCLIDPLGNTINETKMFTKTELTVAAHLENNKTFYTKHPLLIPYFAGIISILIILIFYTKQIFIFIERRRKKNYDKNY